MGSGRSPRRVQRPAGAFFVGETTACDCLCAPRRLPDLEARQNALRVAPFAADQFDGDPAFDWFGLVSHPDGAHSPFADLLNNLYLPAINCPGKASESFVSLAASANKGGC
jgi:hypothetical protein